MNDGVILIDKPAGMTSFAVVAVLRRRLQVKCGHSGTLDPMATGLLPVLCGKATKLCDYLMQGDKCYTATLRFGVETDTHDITGKTVKTSDRPVTVEQIREVLPQFLGTVLQTPPAYSAIKVGGVALYQLARRGKQVEIPRREITVHAIDVLDFDGRELTMEIRCSKGTYIRSLCRDIAYALDTVGTMSALRRTATGGWSVTESVPPDAEEIADRLIPIERVLSSYPAFTPEPFFATLLSNGCAVAARKMPGVPDGTCRVYGDRLLGLAETRIVDGEPALKIVTHL